MACHVFRTWDGPKSNSEEKSLLHSLGDVGREFSSSQAPKFPGKVGDKASGIGIDRWEGGCEEGKVVLRGRGGELCWVDVFQNAGSCGIVEGALAGEVGPCGHEEGGVGKVRFGLEEDIGGLAWSDKKYVGVKRFDITSITFNYREGVVGYAEEKFVVECSVDQTEEVRLSWFNLQLVCVCPNSSNNTITSCQKILFHVSVIHFFL